MTAATHQRLHIVAATANARYIHTAFGLRCLIAVLKEAGLVPQLMEFTIDDRAADLAEKILAADPTVVLLGVHIWNTELMTEVASLVRRLRPAVKIVVGGPEVSFSPEDHPIFPWVDRVVTGEGEGVIVRTVRELTEGATAGVKIDRAPPPDLDRVPLPYYLYSAEDIRHRLIYIETSRGCPLGCEFCLSSLDPKVRRFPEDKVLAALEDLWQRGARHFKFVDRALHLGAAEVLLDYFLAKKDANPFLHFELIPDRLPQPLFEKLKAFPKGQVQLEAGIQTLNEEVSARIHRKQNTEKALSTLAALRKETGVHLHADLVVGLPGETLTSFTAGFNRLYALGLHEIQVGILKKLRGAPIARHDDEWQMIYARTPPYEILQTRDIDFESMQRLKRFAKFFDLVCNRGNFRHLVPRLIGSDPPFESLMALSAYLYCNTGRTHGIALNRLSEMLCEYAVEVKGVPLEEATGLKVQSFEAAGRKERGKKDAGPPARQKRHL